MANELGFTVEKYTGEWPAHLSGRSRNPEVVRTEKIIKDLSANGEIVSFRLEHKEDAEAQRARVVKAASTLSLKGLETRVFQEEGGTDWLVLAHFPEVAARLAAEAEEDERAADETETEEEAPKAPRHAHPEEVGTVTFLPAVPVPAPVPARKATKATTTRRTAARRPAATVD